EVLLIEEGDCARLEAKAVEFAVGVGADQDDLALGGARFDLANALDPVFIAQDHIDKRDSWLHLFYNSQCGTGLFSFKNLGMRQASSHHSPQLGAITSVVVDNQEALLALLVGAALLAGLVHAKRIQQLGVLIDIINGFEAALYIELAVEASQMVFDRLDAQPHSAGDRLVIEPFLQMGEQTILAAGQRELRAACGDLVFGLNELFD